MGSRRAFVGPNETTPLLSPPPWRETANRMMPYILPSPPLRLTAVISLIMVILNKATALLPAVAYKFAVDTLTDNIVNGVFNVPYFALFVFIFARLASGAFQAGQTYFYAVVAADSTRRFSVDIFDHLQGLSLAYHLKRKTGEITRIMNRGVMSIDTMINTCLFTLLPTIAEALVITAIFVSLGTPWVAFTTFMTVVAYFVLTFLVTGWRNKWRRDLNEADNKVSDKAIDTLLNYETVKMFGMETEEVRTYNELQTIFQKKYVFFRATLGILNMSQNSIQNVGRGIAMILAAQAAASGSLTVGDFVLINTYIIQLFTPLFFLGSSYRIITQAGTDLERCIMLLNTEVTVKDQDDAVPLVMKEADVVSSRVGEVRFENVCFSYDTTEERSSHAGLKNITFTIPPGKMVAIVGASGAGKSTIMRLMMRFYDVDKGQILIDGQNINSFTQQSLRRHIGVVAQDTVLFNDTLRQNIAYGKQDASDAEIFAAAHAAALTPFISTLPLGLDTVVGERGVRLSGGERQRVGCARCIIKAPLIVLLDEASSSLDTRTEREMQQQLREVCRNRTTIVVAHRLSTIMMADEIIVLGKVGGVGVIVERGAHTELLKRGSAYKEMWEAQTILDEELGKNGSGKSKEIDGDDEIESNGGV